MLKAILFFQPRALQKQRNNLSAAGWVLPAPVFVMFVTWKRRLPGTFASWLVCLFFFLFVFVFCFLFFVFNAFCLTFHVFFIIPIPTAFLLLLFLFRLSAVKSVSDIFKYNLERKYLATFLILLFLHFFIIAILHTYPNAFFDRENEMCRSSLYNKLQQMHQTAQKTQQASTLSLNDRWNK